MTNAERWLNEPGRLELFERAKAEFLQLQAEDPAQIPDDAGSPRPKAWVEAQRLAVWVERLCPDASVALRLAAYCQHLKRWEIPRGDYPEGRKGYLAWRAALAKFHAEKSSEVLERLGFEPELVEAVRRINLKKGLGAPGDAQVMEDALCVCFLNYDLEGFAAKHPKEKLLDIIRKTWKKMSARGKEQALELPLSFELKQLVAQALAEP